MGVVSRTMTRGNGPTIEIRTEIFERVARDRWAWVPAGRDFPDEPDYVYTGDELTRALYVYSATTARFLPTDRGRFRLVACSRRTGGVLGIHEWQVSEETGRWVPTDAPWVIWGDCHGRAA
nr:hypothetical protein KPHV_40350 [Kitasatospora purpeofusca]